MELTVSKLKDILSDAVFINFNGTETYDSFDIVNIGISYNSKNKLFFAVYDTTPDIEGWIDTPFDKRKKLNVDTTYNSDTYVIEHDVVNQMNAKSKHIIVTNIKTAIEKLFRYVINKTQPTIIGVTGSVGKTTTVALIEDIINTQYKCLRVYSKRITPFVLYTHILNKIDSNTKYIVLEYAMYRKNHIEILTNILPPNIAVFLNIKKSHIGIDNIKNTEDILKAKKM